MFPSSIKMDENQEASVENNIKKILTLINDTSLKIQHELKIINELTKKDGQLHRAVINSNNTLTTVATNMDINVKEILSEEENRCKIDLQSVLNSTALTEKILACIRD